MSNYEVFIGRDNARFRIYYVSVKPKGQRSWYKTRRSFTLWGARRNARKIIADMVSPPRTHRVEEYEL